MAIDPSSLTASGIMKQVSTQSSVNSNFGQEKCEAKAESYFLRCSNNIIT